MCSLEAVPGSGSYLKGGWVVVDTREEGYKSERIVSMMSAVK